jgi:hypothetical protein
MNSARPDSFPQNTAHLKQTASAPRSFPSAFNAKNASQLSIAETPPIA